MMNNNLDLFTYMHIVLFLFSYKFFFVVFFSSFILTYISVRGLIQKMIYKFLESSAHVIVSLNSLIATE